VIITPEEKERRGVEFLKKCPPLFLHTDPARLPTAAQVVLKWRYNPIGLYLVGPTGTGKSRTAWLLLKRLILDDGRSAITYDGAGWSMAASAAYADSRETATWMNRVCSTQVLFVDDLFKGKMTETQEVAAFTLIERRSLRMLPTIITTNATSASILDRMSDASREDRGLPMIRRLKEFYQWIKFSE
jgi:DNA replication protein DnaC